MLCTRCGEREAEKVIYVEAGPPGSPPRTSLEERRAREEELSRLCERCLLEVAFPPEHFLHMQRLLDEQDAIHAAAAAQPASEALRPVLDALEAEAIRDPADVALTRKRLTELLQYLVSPEGRTLANFDATMDRLQWASDWGHLPMLEREILRALSGPTMEAVWQPESPGANAVLPEQLLAKLQTES
jgi:hypothetical protein